MRPPFLGGRALFPAPDVKLLANPPTAAAEIALRRKLTAYDAPHLWLAAELGAGLLTLDDSLMRDWRRHRLQQRLVGPKSYSPSPRTA